MCITSKQDVINALLKNKNNYLKDDFVVIRCDNEQILRVEVLIAEFGDIHFALNSSVSNVKVDCRFKINDHEIDNLLNGGSDIFIEILIRKYNESIMLRL